jgi:hypothetical protein
MNLGTGSPINFNINTSNLFVEAWIYFVTFPPAYSLLMSVGTGLSDNYGKWFIAMGASNNIRFTTRDADNATEYNATSSTTLSTSRWYHIAASLDIVGDNMRTFIDGSLSATFSVAGKTFANPTTTALIGATFNLSVSNIGAYIRDLRVVQGGVVPVATFTPLASAPFSYASPTYVPNMGTTVFTLLGQFVTYNPSGKYGSSLVLLNPKVGGSSNVANTTIAWTTSISSNAMKGVTVSYWINFYSIPPNDVNLRSLIFKYGSLYTTNYGTNLLQGMYDGSGYPGAVNTFNPTIGTWYHLTQVYGSGLITSYVNGSSLPNIGTFTTAVTDSNPVLRIASDSFLDFPSSFQMDDLRIYNTALTSAQVQSIYSSQGAPAPSRAMPLPRLAWDFNGTTTDYVSGLVPTTTGGSPIYVSGKYSQAINFPNSTSTGTVAPTHYLTYTTTLNYTTGVSFFFWVNFSFGGVFAQVILEAGALNIFLDASNRLQSFDGAGLSFPATTIQVGTWYHVGLVVANGTRTAYLNGVSTTGSTTATGTRSGFSIGGAPGNNYSAWCSYDDLRIFDRALTSLQVQSIYSTQGVPSRQVLSGTPLFSQLSSGATSSAVGAFSLRAVNGTSARAVNVAPGGTFPPSAMTQTGTNSSTQTLGTGKLNGSYIASSSRSNYGWGASGAFALQTNSVGPYIWQVDNYPVGGGSLSTPTTTTTGATNYNGEWLQFQTPFPINLTGYSAFTNHLTSVVLLASTTGATSSWILVDSKSAITVGSTITNTGLNFAGYSYFRFVVITSTQVYPLLGDVRFFGTVPSLAQDFYADRLGNLLTAPVTGQSLANWLGGATGYVTTWYDQSGRGNHASQLTAANQPIIQRATKGPGYSALFNGTTTQLVSTLSGSLDSTNYTICSASRRRAAGEMYYIGTNGPSSTRQQLSAGYYTDTTTILNEQSYALVGVTIPGYSSGAEPMGYDYSVFSQTNGMYIYNWRSGTSYASGNSGLTLPMTSSGNILLGYAPWNGGNKYFSGEVFELTIFKTSLFDLSGSTPGTYTTPPSIIQSIYNNQLGAYGT